MEDLQETIDKVPASDVLLLLGDFNARVGASSVSDDDLWRGVRGKYGVGVAMRQERDFLSSVR